MKSNARRVGISFLCIVPLSAVLVQSLDAATDPFAEMVRSADPLPAEEQLRKFHLPPGFEIQLVASEPAIGKPMNIAFDTKGRLWLTQSREYPFPAPLDTPGRDKVMVLENFGRDGKAQKITTFADGLNIPIGLYPYKNGVLAYSIPNIFFLQDTDGDGRADKKEVFLGSFGWEKDTHGMTGAFRRGYEGWIYADHGFKNDTSVAARDGSRITMNSGNAYRVKADASSVEQYSHGQVNPFGLSFDHLGDLWSSDCHSAPVYMLLRGGYYPSFGKPHDGLGFAPSICAHSHGSTAIAGIVFYAATNFPSEYRNNTFIGNPMTSRINRDSFVEQGSTRIAKEEADFLRCDDPWFRPVDIQLGPDGALYVADFYNRIIGHYEVPLDHPGRDRERGRIWRIVYTGQKGTPVSTEMPRDLKGLAKELGNPNIARRMLAMNELSDCFGEKAIKPMRKVLEDRDSGPEERIHALWILHRLGAVEEETVIRHASHSSREVRVHAMRILSETKDWTAGLRDAALGGLRDYDSYVQRAAADAIGQHPDYGHIQPLLTLRHSIDPRDTQLLHTVRMALRNQLQDSMSFGRLLAANFLEADSRAIAEVAMGIKSPEAAQYLLKHIVRVAEEREKMIEYLGHIARHAPDEELSEMARITRWKFAEDIDFQLSLFRSVQEGMAQRGTKLTPVLHEWGAALADKLLSSTEQANLEWRNVPVPGLDPTNPWNFEERKPQASSAAVRMLSSLSPGGERYTGVFTSKVFDLPAKLTFLLAGHDGYPNKPAQNKNLVRLREAGSNTIIMEAPAPRHDRPVRIEWDLAAHSGKKGFIEVIDADTGDAFAWIAVASFEPAVAALPQIMPRQMDQRQLAAAQITDQLDLKQLEGRLLSLLRASHAASDVRAAAAKALLKLNRSAHLPTVEAVLGDANVPAHLREKAAQLVVQGASQNELARVVQATARASGSLQNRFASALAGSKPGAEALLKAITDGQVSPRVLQDRTVKERLTSSKPARLEESLNQLTRQMPAADAEKEKMIEEFRARLNPVASSRENGAKVFSQNCAICHQLDGQGALVGPQLDGVGSRGADRLLEDILDPNRNVDHAFRYSNVTLKDDQVITGLFRREEGALLVFADATGKEIKVAKAEVAERHESANSLMPDNFHETLKPQDLNDLLAFMLSKTGK